MIAPAEVLTTAPRSVALADAARCRPSGLTAWQALFEVVGLKAGQTILINGAGGAVGGYAVQLAKQAGAVVTATASARSATRLRRYGVDRLIDYIDYTATPIAVDGKPFDVVLNLVEYFTGADRGPCRRRRRRWVPHRHHDLRAGKPRTASAQRSASSCAATLCPLGEFDRCGLDGVLREQHLSAASPSGMKLSLLATRSTAPEYPCASSSARTPSPTPPVARVSSTISTRPVALASRTMSSTGSGASHLRSTMRTPMPRIGVGGPPAGSSATRCRT